MARQVIWTIIAMDDLDEVAEFIARDSAYYARAFVEEVRDAASSLALQSERGRVVPEFDDNSIRELFVRNYRLIYLLKDTTVFIIGFIHGARDLWGLWDEGRKKTN